MRLLIIVFLCASPAFGQQQQSHTCSATTQTKPISWGNLTWYAFADRTIKTLNGTIKGWSGNQQGVLVEIYLYRKGDPIRRPDDSDSSQPRLYACVTGVSGDFEFNVASGQYQVIVSQRDCRSEIFIVKIDRKRGKSKAITISLEPDI